ncbi:magnesium-translocating P-type ATPase [Longilinea arvoryzae]|uniref:Magnesium-transporting ATPase, P-type 1 n=1 Tax=Longilinea arvoryzae TaxID=360412 RepID=A0A0S7B5I9_9CHLR|nr:magnesium-translocating P-type ATPase [Longilinea arvoryzae]GAP12431.1 magnesium-translocating P-type ATPase [Longilinea arvoryzae]
MAKDDLITQYWSQTPETLGSRLNTSLKDGLSPAEAAQRLKSVGPNQIRKKARATPLRLLFNQFKSPIVLILLGATLISAFLSDWVDAMIIFGIVLGSALLSFFQEYSANSAAEKLRAQVSLKSQVVRSGQTLSIPSEEIVPGDVVLLAAGSLIPADGVVLEAKDFFISQSVLTGETFPVEKTTAAVAAGASLSERTNVVYMGTSVRSGSARVLIVETGAGTAFGQIADRLVLRPPETEFESGIRRLGYLLTEVMFVLVLGIFAFNVYFHKPILDSLLFSIALAVGLTPQLLPAIININLARGSQSMARHGVIVRRLESIENFGSMDILCTDKTGTLTVGVVELNGTMDASGQPSTEVDLYAYLNASLQTGLPNTLDQAIVAKGADGAGEYEKIDEIPYDFVRKRLSVVVEHNHERSEITKGALENVLAVCSHVRLNGQDQPMDTERQADLQKRFEDWSEQGYRVLGVATKSVPVQQHAYEHSDEASLTFVGYLLFLDPPKPGVEEAIRGLEKLGVQLKIITGDNHLVAKHTAAAVGLGDVKMLTGSDLDKLRDAALWNAVETTTIFAEVDPNEKERIILALKKRRHVVGYMGDGINDAPSLHSADVGISVANAVDVAKEAADLVLLKQDLDVLREGIQQGRKTFANTLKYVFMATSANFGNMFSMAGASLFLPFLPMLPKQILLINFLTDLPEMTIAGDNVDPIYIERPHRWDIAFIRRFMLVFGPLSSVFDFATFAVLLWGLRASEQAFHTGWFIESIVSASLVVFTIRTRLPLGRSHPSRAMMLVTAFVALFSLLLPFTPLAAPLGLTPLPITTVLILLAIVALYFMFAELTKRWFYRRLQNQ